MKNKKNTSVPLMIMLITVESNTKEAVLVNPSLQAARSGPEQQA